jgi:hypothetical protein
MTHLKYLEGLSPTGKTKNIVIFSEYDNTILGQIAWSGRWRQYVFEPTIELETMWSYDCLEELSQRLIILNKEQRKKQNETA